MIKMINIEYVRRNLLIALEQILLYNKSFDRSYLLGFIHGVEYVDEVQEDDHVMSLIKSIRKVVFGYD